jgi:hypothetical protein
LDRPARIAVARGKIRGGRRSPGMKKITKSKLHLNAETIRSLLPSELPHATGGQEPVSISKCYCHSDMCPTGFAPCAGSLKCG